MAIIDFLPTFVESSLHDLNKSVQLSVTGLTIIALILGFFTAIARIGKIKILKIIGTIYVSMFRGTPLLIQIFVIYYGLPQINIELDPISSGILALSLNAGSYLSESFRASILAVDKGQMEAAVSMGIKDRVPVRATERRLQYIVGGIPIEQELTIHSYLVLEGQG